MTKTTSHSECVAEAGPFAVPARPVARLAGVMMIMLCLLFQSSLAAGDETVTASPNQVKAAFLRNFAHYVTWPTNTAEDAHAPWRIGILGADPFGEVLGKTFEGRIEQARSFVIFRADTLEKLPPCDIIYIAEKDAKKRHAALAALKGQPVLTVGDAPGFLQEGGIIRFHVGDRVEMSVNLDQARAVSLKIPCQMLEVSREVLENGTLRKLR
jgi:hypothetical protein